MCQWRARVSISSLRVEASVGLALAHEPHGDAYLGGITGPSWDRCADRMGDVGPVKAGRSPHPANGGERKALDVELRRQTS